MATEAQAKVVKAKYGADLRRRPGVFAISLQRAAPDQFVLCVFVDKSVPLPEVGTDRRSRCDVPTPGPTSSLNDNYDALPPSWAAAGTRSFAGSDTADQ